MLRKGPGTKGASEPEAGQGGGGGGSQSSHPERPGAAPSHPVPGATTVALNLPAAASRPPSRAPPTTSGRPSASANRKAPKHGGAGLVSSEVTCSARLARESVEALLSGQRSQLRREKNMAWTLVGAKAQVAEETEAPAA